MHREMTGRFDGISQYYDSLVERHGYDPKACDYGRRESQIAKFQVLAEFLPMEGQRVLDVGCGFADFAEFLHQRHGKVQYTGIDISPRMIDEARRRHPQLDLRLANVLSDEFEEPFDIVLANGIFYLLGNEAADLMQELIRKMFGLARAGVAFTSLSAWANRQEAGEFYADPVQTLEYCRGLTPRLVLRHDYLPHDFTIYMYRAPLPRT
jgi:SAM-dependent methyltransferase